MTASQPLCPECGAAMGINPLRIGEYVCYACGCRHFEDIRDVSTFLPRTPTGPTIAPCYDCGSVEVWCACFDDVPEDRRSPEFNGLEPCPDCGSRDAVCAACRSDIENGVPRQGALL